MRMSKALVKSASSSGSGSGLVPAACSLVIPGVGQFINGETDKAIGVFVVAAATGAAFLGGLPLIGGLLGLVHLATWSTASATRTFRAAESSAVS